MARHSETPSRCGTAGASKADLQMATLITFEDSGIPCDFNTFALRRLARRFGLPIGLARVISTHSGFGRVVK
ncbi:MAG: hypothetical protein AAGF20_09835 [Pseudomonadota bacterium]